MGGSRANLTLLILTGEGVVNVYYNSTLNTMLLDSWPNFQAASIYFSRLNLVW